MPVKVAQIDRYLAKLQSQEVAQARTRPSGASAMSLWKRTALTAILWSCLKVVQTSRSNRPQRENDCAGG